MNKDKSKIRKKTKREAVLLLAFIAAVIWLALVLIKFYFAYKAGTSFGSFIQEIGDEILNNILGVIPPIIFIDLAFEAKTQEIVTEETKEQITSALMSNTDIIDLFDVQAKQNFLHATISSITENREEETQMAASAIAPYLKAQYNYEKYFDYSISLWDIPEGHKFFDRSRYMMVSEILQYEKYYISSAPLASIFKIGFFTKNGDLDKNLRGHDYLFRESLSIYSKDLEVLANLSDQEKIDFVKKEMALKVYIDHTLCEIESVSISTAGIAVILKSSHDCSKKNFYVDTVFNMPQIKDRTSFLAYITVPTFGVNIRFTYPRDSYKVTMIPFFSDTKDALVEESDRGVGSCDIHIRDKWIYPMSGVVFNIDLKK